MSTYPQQHLEKGLSYSAIKLILERQPKGYWWQYIQGHYPEPSPDMVLGTALHCLVLEPEKFDSRFSVGDYDGRTKEGKALKAELEAKGLPIIRAADMEDIRNAAEALRSHPRLAGVFSRPDNLIEQTWQGLEPESGVKLQAKPDVVTADGKVMLEIKKAKSADPEDFAGDVGTYYYDLQAAVYTDVSRQNGMAVDAYIWAVVETQAPYLCALYSPDQDTLSVARGAYKNACSLWQACLQSGKWPGYESKIKTIGVRPWVAKSRLTQREGE